jgi:hypothetical protein
MMSLAIAAVLAGQSVPTLHDHRDLKRDFNAATGKVRLLVMLAPS